jgi:hypothetical protein
MSNSNAGTDASSSRRQVLGKFALVVFGTLVLSAAITGIVKMSEKLTSSGPPSAPSTEPFIDYFDMTPILNGSVSNVTYVDSTAGGYLRYNGFIYGNDTRNAALKAVSGNGWIGFNNVTQEAEGLPNFTTINSSVEYFGLDNIYYACIPSNASDPSAPPTPVSCAIQASTNGLSQQLAYDPGKSLVFLIRRRKGLMRRLGRPLFKEPLTGGSARSLECTFNSYSRLPARNSPLSFLTTTPMPPM